MKAAASVPVRFRFAHIACASQAAAFVVALAIASVLPSSAESLKLEGQSKNSAGWTAGHLTGWQENNEVPCRILITDGPIDERTISIHFPHLTRDTPGFDNLVDFTASPNAILTSAPVLTANSGGERHYSFKVKVTDSGPAHIEFKARLAKGSYGNSGSSLMLRGDPSSMGNLQIFKPVARRAPVLRLRIVRSEVLPNGAFVLEFNTDSNRVYQVEFSEDLQDWRKRTPTVAGTGATVEWIDETRSRRNENRETGRERGFYRVMVLPDDC